MDNHDEWLDGVPELAHFIKRPSLLVANGFYWAVGVVFTLVQAGLTPLYWLLTAVWAIDPNGFVAAAQVLMYIGAMLLPVAVYILSHPDTLDSFRLNPVSPGRALTSVAAAGVGFLAANFLTMIWMLFLESIGGDVMSTASDILSGNMMLDMLLIAILPGVCEELLFRGLIMGAYERWGTWKAIWISALMFAGMHGSLAGIPAHLMLGVALGYVAASTGSLYAPMMMHTAYNAVTVLASYAALSEEASAAQTLAEEMGGMSGVMMAAVMAVIFVAVFIALLRYLDRQRVRADEPFGNDAVIERRQLSRSELVVLVSGVATVVWFYVQDALTLFV